MIEVDHENMSQNFFLGSVKESEKRAWNQKMVINGRKNLVLKFF